jgi:hypothetical protein
MYFTIFPGSSLLLLVSTIFFSLISAHADQPVFNEMPRWDNGWGVQMVEEYRRENELLLGRNSVGSNLSEEVHILHVEGVYTWDKAIRLTAKLPFVIDARRELLDDAGGKIVQHDSGVGDLTLAVPIKKYFNLDGRSGSWTLAPQIRIPLSGDDSYEIYDGEWGQGLSLGYETETYRWLFSVGTTAWTYFGKEPFESFSSLKVGRNFSAFESSGHIKFQTLYHYEDDNSSTLSVGPALFYSFSDSIHGQAQWLVDVYDRQGTLDHGRGNTIKLGIAYVY